MPTPFRPALTLLTQYAAYHRDRRNIQTHLVGVPLIVFAIGVLLSRPVFELAGLEGLDHAVRLRHAADPTVALDAHAMLGKVPLGRSRILGG